MSRSLIPFSVAAVLVVSACSIAPMQVGVNGGDPYYTAISMDISAAAVDWRATGDSLSRRIMKSADSLRSGGARAKTSLAISGGVATFFGAASAALIGTFTPQDTKAGIGLGAALASAGIGLYQVVKGVKKEALDYVIAADQTTAEWMISITSAEDDAAKKAAYLDLLSGAMELRRTYPEWALFEYNVDPHYVE